MSKPSHSELSLLRSSARLSENNHIPATEADSESESVVKQSSAFRFSSFRAGRTQVASKNTQRNPVNHRQKLAIDLQESRNFSDLKENCQKDQNEKNNVAADSQWAHTTQHRQEERGEDVQHDIEAGLKERNPAEFLNVLRRLKEKHEKNLKRVEEMYYGSSNSVEEPDSNDAKEKVSSEVIEVEDLMLQEWSPTLTIPQPFEFMKRDATPRTSIAKRKMQKYMEELEKKKEDEVSHTFHPNPVPKSTSEKRFEALTKANEERREMNKYSSTEIMLKRQRPFTFAERDAKMAEEKAARNAKSAPSTSWFKAKPVPWKVKVALFDQMNETKEKQRQERVEKRAKALLQESSLPGRMALYEEKKRLKETQAENRRRRQEKKSFQSKNVPNFKRLQKNFEAQLSKVKQLKNPTVPNTFRFSGTKQYSKASEEANEANLFKPLKRKTVVYKQTEFAPATTKKFTQSSLLVRRRLQERRVRKQQEQKKAEFVDEEKRKLWAQRLAPHLIDNSKALKARMEEQRREARDQEREAKKRSKQMLEEMRERVNRAPLLLETDQRQKERIQARKKALLAVRDSLVAAGVKDYKRFFDEQELDELELEV